MVGLTIFIALAWIAVEVMSTRGTSRGEANALAGNTEPPAVEAGWPEGTPVFPGILSVADAEARGDEWYLLDTRRKRVHRLLASLDSLPGFGRAGSGPGELRSPTSLGLLGDTVVVAERTGGVVHLYDLTGNHRSDRRIEGAACPGPGIVDLAPSSAGLLVLVVCFDDSLALEARVVLATAEDGSRILASRTNGSGAGRMDPYFLPVMSPHPRGFVFGLANDACLESFDLQGTELGPVCHRWIQRFPIPEGEQAKLDRTMTRARQLGMDLEEPDVLPPFDGLFSAPGPRLIYRATTTDGSQARRLVQRGESGEEVVLPFPTARYYFVDGTRALAGWEDLEGTRITFYEIDSES